MVARPSMLSIVLEQPFGSSRSLAISSESGRMLHSMLMNMYSSPLVVVQTYGKLQRVLSSINNGISRLRVSNHDMFYLSTHR
jgi:hypothetical protein